MADASDPNTHPESSADTAALGRGWRLDNSYAQLPPRLFAEASASGFPAPQLVRLNEPLAESMGLDFDGVSQADRGALFSGQSLPPGGKPIAQAYAGHQFGGFAVLGDGRAMLLGEQITPSGERLDLQLKGSGPTAFSRRGDGLAALGPMLREYLISEAMHGLGIPTTRSLAVVATGRPVMREAPLPGAVLTRVAKSHLRVGTFQYAAALNDIELLKALVDYTIARHDPPLADAPDRALRLLESVMDRQASLVAKWQCVGFIHGVMNTDNVAICGETIDYGPCAFMDVYDPATVFSSIDTQGRYAYGNQPPITHWNLARFAEALLPLIDEHQEAAVDKAVSVLDVFAERFGGYWLKGMAAKLGIVAPEANDREMVEGFLEILREQRVDFTNGFLALTQRAGSERLLQAQPPALSLPEAWLKRWTGRIHDQPGGRSAAIDRMRAANPLVIPRNHRVEAALAAASEAGDFGPLDRLLGLLKTPFDPAGLGPEDQAGWIEGVGDDASYATYCGT